jgi:hypothetical protein
MGDGKNPDYLVPDDIGNVLREYLEIDSSIAVGSRARHFGILGYPGDVLIHFLPES